RRSSDHTRINVQLIDSQADAHVWTERFDRDITDLFALQDEVVRQIAVALNLELVALDRGRPTGWGRTVHSCALRNHLFRRPAEGRDAGGVSVGLQFGVGECPAGSATTGPKPAYALFVSLTYPGSSVARPFRCALRYSGIFGKRRISPLKRTHGRARSQ